MGITGIGVECSHAPTRLRLGTSTIEPSMATDEDMQEMMARHRAAMAEHARQELERSAESILRFIELAATKGVSLNSSNFKYVLPIGVVASAPNLGLTLLGPIQKERDGLLSYDELTSRLEPSGMQSGYFVGPSYMLMAHPCYRRGMYHRESARLHARSVIATTNA